MMKAHGLIEILGLASAVTAMDTAVKAANVMIVGLEPAKGQGLHTIKLSGEVGAVKAAVSAVLGSSLLQGKVYAHTVIARPSDEIRPMLEEKMPQEEKESPKEDRKIIAAEEASLEETLKEETISGENLQAEEPIEEGEKEEASIHAEEPPSKSIPEKKPATCNLCADTACKRVKGEPHALCIHYNEKEK
jgi:microcompartment protein CcmL/EutN